MPANQCLDIGQVVLQAILEDANFQRNLDKISKKSLNVFSGIANAGKAAFAGIAIAVAALAVPVAALAVSGVKASASFEQTTVAFTTLLKSADTAQRVLTDLNKFAAETPFQFPELANATRNLAAFGVNANDLILTLQRIGDVASGVSQPIGEIAEIYGKARVQGRLFMEDVNQLTGRGIPIIGELAKQFGVTESEVRKLVESGKVNFGNLEQAFISLTSEGGEFFGRMDAQSRTLLGRWSTFTDNLNQLNKRIGDRIVETFDLKGVLEGAISLLERWAPRVEQIVQTVLNIFKTTIIGYKTFITNAIEILRSAYERNFLGIRTAVNWFAENVGTRITAVITWFNKLVSNTDLLGMTFERVFKAMGDILKGAGLIVYGYVIEPFVRAYNAVSVALSGTIENIAAFINDLATKLEPVTNFAKSLGVQISGIFSSTSETISESFGKKIAEGVANLTAAIGDFYGESQAIKDGYEFINKGSSGIAAAVAAANTVMESTTKDLKTEVDNLGDSLGTVQTPLADTATNIEGIGDSADTAAGKVVKLAQSISSDLLNAILAVREYDPLSSFNKRGVVDISNKATVSYNDLPIPDPGARATRTYVEGIPDPEQLRRFTLTVEQVTETQRILAETSEQLAAIQEEANRKTQDFTSRLDELNAFSAKATELSQSIAEVESEFASVASEQALQRVLESSYT